MVSITYGTLFLGVTAWVCTKVLLTSYLRYIDPLPVYDATTGLRVNKVPGEAPADWAEGDDEYEEHY